MVTADLLEPAPLHPAARRRIQARMPRAEAHETVLRPLGGGGSRTVIITSNAQDCVSALMEDLKAPDWRARLDKQRRLRKGDGDDMLELNQPIHRRFQIALFEAACVQPGSPRLNPAKIRSSGLVVRRLQGRSTRMGWMKSGKTVEGWLPLTIATADPDPARAAMPHPANAALHRAMAAQLGNSATPPAETVHGLYVAPPDVCTAMGRTVLFSVIPVSSAETSDRAADGIDYANLPASDRSEMVRHFSEYLKERPERDMPRGGDVLDDGWNVLDQATMVADPRLASLGTFLHQAMVELDVLGGGQAAVRLRAVLAEIRLPVSEDSLGRTTASITAAEFAQRAGPILIGRENNGAQHVMPLRWPAVSAELGKRLCDAALACLTEQFKGRVGSPGKFANDAARYVVRGFIRVAGHDDCPEKLVWSAESEPFRILPWWDGEGPGTTISLPDMANLKKVKPSVAFSMPPAIANLLKGNMKDLAEGKGSTDGPQIGWLCSFSIPFITICAFIVLNIFLSLFDIIFRWMLFIKLCIPIPRSK